MYVDDYSHHVEGGSLKPVLEALPPLSPLVKTSHGKVFVQGVFANHQTRMLFETYGYQTVDRWQEADIVCWTGGEDINPRIYNEEPAGAEHWSTRRDSQDLAMIYDAKDRFKVGICRGAQLLNCVPNNGTLWQDVDAHIGTHDATDVITGEKIRLNSLHHQGIRLTEKAEMVAFTNIATEKYSYSNVWYKDRDEPDPDVEAAWYPETRCLLMQWHPEFDVKGPSGFYFQRLMERYYLAA